MLKEKLKAYEEQKAYTDKNGEAKLMISSSQEKEIGR